jgi:hypothetical protein
MPYLHKVRAVGSKATFVKTLKFGRSHDRLLHLSLACLLRLPLISLRDVRIKKRKLVPRMVAKREWISDMN